MIMKKNIKNILQEKTKKDLTIEAVRAQWENQYRKVEELCNCILLCDETRDISEKEKLFAKAVQLSNELLE